MAENGDKTVTHRGTYDAFITLVKWGTIAVALVTAFVIYLLVG